MDLLTPELVAELPALYSSEDMEDPLVRCKLFDPCSRWTWYVLEYDGEDICFGLVVGQERELGYFSLTELTYYRGPYGIGIERDLHFTPCPLSTLMDKDE